MLTAVIVLASVASVVHYESMAQTYVVCWNQTVYANTRKHTQQKTHAQAKTIVRVYTRKRDKMFLLLLSVKVCSKRREY